ncbi:hypothetical protein RIM91_35505, partial [Pseudomonas aeruginosa]|nr:hypothetical protein [Pseudomonas aeruginosa]
TLDALSELMDDQQPRAFYDYIRYDVCLTQYAQELSVIRYVVLFIAAILAGWIVFYRS